MRAWGALAIAVLLGCGRTVPLRTPQPALDISASPLEIDTFGERTTLTVTARVGSRERGTGKVRLLSTAGSLRSGTDVTLVNGEATVALSCDFASDNACVKDVGVTAIWAQFSPTATASTTVQLKPRVLDGGHPLCPGGTEVRADAGPIERKCAPLTASECDGPTDVVLAGFGIEASRRNAISGNGFDDDCDGLVDEGCACPTAGLTKPCFVVPPSQVGDGGTPVGWCATNARGTVDCAGQMKWSGVCRGGSAPAETDTCDPGDFDCDGAEANSRCKCTRVSLKCPTEAITLAPFPDPKKLTEVDGNAWLDEETSARATRWRWTAIGGDCDNVLPHPTFALYRGTDSTQFGRPAGRDEGVLLDMLVSPPRLVLSRGSPLRGVVADTGDGPQGGRIAPAFGLSGDYLLQGQFEVDGVTHSCSQKVQVRASGIRAELCWDESVGSVDVDLHVARLQGAFMCQTNGWDDLCADGEQDCFYNRTIPNWSYTSSPNTACDGWSSRGGPIFGTGCNNPRLDQDNVACDENEADPTRGTFCGPENINLDAPRDNDRFVIGANYYEGSRSVGVHANVYCNGERIASMGVNPVTGATFPRLKTSGQDSAGDFWMAAVVTAHVSDGQLTSCTVEPIPSHSVDLVREGTNSLCVEATDNVDFNYMTHAFVEAGTVQGLQVGSIPLRPIDWCKH